jgi:hypothetical protein
LANLPPAAPSRSEPSCPITVKGYHEFGAENTFEGDVADAAVSFKF